MNAPTLQTLEQLVDGELSLEAYRATLAAVERNPAQWKTLAGLFLEAQALRVELAPSVTHSVTILPPREKPLAFSPRSLFAAAACLLLGLGLGTFLPQRPAPPIVDRDPPAPVVEPLVAAAAPLREVSVPVYSAGEVDPLTLWTSSTALPPGVVERAREHNQSVVREFQVVPVSLADGSRIAFPVERVKLVATPTY